jgi:class 3 adenylate cyclase/predicted ATPase
MMRTLGPFRLDTEAGILFRGAEPVALGSRAVALLRVLTERPGVPVSKDVLIEAAWSGNVVEESNLTVQITALRRALGEEPGAERWIETLPRRGYRFVGPIAETEGNAESRRTGVERADIRAERGAGRRSPVEAERRQLTVMCCELVGAAVRPGGMDLDDLHEVISAYHTCVASTVARFNGFVDRYLGSNVLVYFGYPTAREDDADQAVRAGLELCAAIGTLKSSVDVGLRCRVGIATGVVIVGDLVAVGAMQERGLVGDAPNVANRLQALGQPGTVVIEQTTRRLVGNLFDCWYLATTETSGASEPAQAWRVVGGTTVESRFEALRSAVLTPLVGREEELELVQRRWRRAAQGEGQLVLIVGEPGIGKSRLAAALRECLATEAHAEIRYFCSPDRQDSALFPVISHLGRIADFAPSDTPERKFDKLVALLVSDGLAEGDISLVVELLSLRGGERYPPLELSPQRKKERTQAALLRQLEGFARRRRPLLIIFEDLHWIDQTSRELLDFLAEQIRRLPILLVATARPEFDPAWTGLSGVTLVALNRLARSDGATLARQLIGTYQPLPDELVNEIVRHADGVPLFVEELTKAVVEAHIDQRREAIAPSPAPSLVIPATLHASLLARLDRLGSPTKQVAQVGAALGKEFSYDLLTTASQLTELHVRSGLQRLVEAGLVFQRGAPPHATFMFKHALVLDIAYSTLLRPARRELHRRVAHALEGRFPERAASEPDVLAHHFAQAGLPGKAAGYYLLAGHLATRRSALVEAIHHLERGLHVLSKAPRGAERLRQELELHLALATARASAMGHAAPEVMEAYKTARGLCEELADTKRLYTVLTGQFQCQFTRVERGAALRTAEEIFQLSGDRGNREASLLVGMSLYQLGKLEPAESFVRQSLFTAKSIEPRPPARAIQDGRVFALMFHSMVLCLLGHLDQADARKREGLERARSLSHPYTLAFALAFACKAHWFYDEAVAPAEQAAELATLSAEQGYSLFLPVGLFHLGRAMIRNGRVPEGIAEMEKGIESYRATGANWTLPYHLGVLAFSYGESAQPEQGLRVVEEALGQAQRTQERWFVPELHRIKGELCVRLSREGEAEIAFKKAAKIAQTQRARLCELRACLSHARLLVKHGQRKGARDLLAPLYASFSEGLETRQLKEAAELFDEPRKGSREATGAG